MEDELEYDGQTVPRAIETGGSISHGEITPENSVSQVFPYSVKDIYGSTVYPENIENVTKVQQNNHGPWPPSSLLERAKNNPVRESTARFSFHPFLDPDYLREMVDGLKEMDYEFVSVTDLRWASAARSVCATERAVSPEVFGFSGLGADSKLNINRPAGPEALTSCVLNSASGSANNSTSTRCNDAANCAASSPENRPRVAQARATATFTLPGNRSIASAGWPENTATGSCPGARLRN